MGGMRPKRELAEGADIIRPLLFASRSDMEDYLAQRGQAYRTDSTNFDTEYSRNKIRHEILPRMAELNSKAVTHINQSAKWMRQAAEYLEKQTKAAERDCCVKENGAWLIAAERFFTYDELIRTELIHRLLAETAGSSKDIGSVHVAEVIALFSKQNGRQMTLPYGITAKKVYEGVRLSRTQEPVFADETEVDCLTPVMRRRLESGETVVITVQNARFFLKILVFSGEIGQIEKRSIRNGWIMIR